MLRVLAIVLAIGFAAPAIAQNEPRLALLIGNQDYPAAVGALSRPHEDVAALAGALREARFGVTVVEDADEDELVSAVETFAIALDRAGPNAVGFFYYAGHGASTDVSGRRLNFLIPARETVTTPLQLRLHGVRLDEVIGALSATSAAAVFVVSDACRNNLRWAEDRGPDRGFVVEARRNGLFIAHATAEGATAPDDGAFAEALAARLSTPGTFAERAFTLAYRDVRGSRDDYRLPTISGALSQDFCFVSCPGEGGENNENDGAIVPSDTHAMSPEELTRFEIAQVIAERFENGHDMMQFFISCAALYDVYADYVEQAGDVETAEGARGWGRGARIVATLTSEMVIANAGVRGEYLQGLYRFESGRHAFDLSEGNHHQSLSSCLAAEDFQERVLIRIRAVWDAEDADESGIDE